jgi:acetoin utilization deacetylase AcuC-like enzyme
MGPVTTQLVYYYPQGHAAHFQNGHPERPERVEAICAALAKLGWWEAFPHLDPILPGNDLLRTIHSPMYIDLLPGICRKGQSLDMDTYTTPATWELAINSAGGAIAIASSVWQGHARRGFALCRPPGHHATPERGMGFCILNNIALAAQYLIQNYGVKRLAIVDLDLHHGNGTQDIFWRRGDVLYISTHQSPLYPGSGELDETGAGPGSRATANFPLPPGTGDQGFQEVMEGLILPLLTRQQAEMVLVSYGFDPHWSDPLGHLQLSAKGYGTLIASLAAWADKACDGKVALFLEGGYDLDAAAACSQAVVAALLGQAWEDPLGPSPRPEGRSWQSVVHSAREIWGL